MTQFYFTENTTSPLPDVVSAALGVNAAGKLTQKDLNKPLKMGTSQNYVICAAGDEIEGVLKAVDPATVNDGFGFGSVQKNKRMVAQVGAGQVGNMAVLALLVADTSAAVGTAQDYPLVKTGVPAIHIWRCIRIVSGTGAAGDLILIERV